MRWKPSDRKHRWPLDQVVLIAKISLCILAMEVETRHESKLKMAALRASSWLPLNLVMQQRQLFPELLSSILSRPLASYCFVFPQRLSPQCVPVNSVKLGIYSE